MPPPRPALSPVHMGDSGGFIFLFILLGGSLLCVAVWFQFHAEISSAVMAFMHWEIEFFRHFTDRFNAADQQLLAADPSLVTPDRILRLMRALGGFVLYPSIALVAILAVLCFMRSSFGRYRQRIDLEWLIREQAISFPGIRAFADRRLRPVGIRAGEPRPADSALEPMEWINAWAMRPADKTKGDQTKADQDKAGKEEKVFDLLWAKQELVRQLGAPWLGVQNAPPAVRCMIAVFALHACCRRREAAGLLGVLSESLQNANGETQEGRISHFRFLLRR